MTRKEAEEWATKNGYEKDRYGSLLKSTPEGKVMKLKITSHSIALLFKLVSVNSFTQKKESRWVRFRSAYLRDVKVTTEGKLSGLRIDGCQSKDKYP